MWLKASTPVIVRMKTGDVTLTPGVPHEFPDAVGQQVVDQTGGKVRAVPPPATVVTVAAPNARPVFWEDACGTLCGPAVPELLAMTGLAARYWVVVTYHGTVWWIRSDRLRPKPRTKKPVRK